ncbi:MAG: ATP-dependent DNA helicase [Polyangiaceae bacterium]|nr:ATP-dependent DNA helicase [Polyangiaceae bacterium]
MPSRDVASTDRVLGPNSPLARRLKGYELREGQLAMARAVQSALDHDKHLFVEAGTGTGKTLAYLVPAVLSGRKIIISTATHALQEQIFEKDLPLVRGVLAEHGVEFRAALMKGLSNYLCRRRLGERLRSGEPVPSDLANVAQWALETRTGDKAELTALEENAQSWRDVASATETRVGAECKYFDECFVTRMRRVAEQADIIVVNHHLFFADLALRTGKGAGYAGAIPACDAVIFDEAHQVEAIATDFFGVRISTAQLDALSRDARRAIAAAKILDSTSMHLVDQLELACHEFFRTWRTSQDVVRSERAASSRRAGESRRNLTAADWTAERLDATSRLGSVLEAMGAFAAAHDRDDAVAILARRITDLRAGLGRIFASANDEPRHWEVDPEAKASDSSHALADGLARDVVWIDMRERSVSLGASPIDLGSTLRERLFDRMASVVCTSATLATATHAGPSFHFAKSRLGAPSDTNELVVPSPFDFASRVALYVAVDLPEPHDSSFEDACARRVAELSAITGGGAFVLCTSNRAMRRVHEQLRAAASMEGPLLVQGEAPKHILLDKFRASGSAVLVATMSFWEGVDVPGRALRLVVIDKIPFAVPTDPIVLARSERIEAEGGNAFTQYSVPSAAITLKQGFGRLIRTKKDAGVVALLDRRAVCRGYGRLLLASLPPAKRLGSLDEVRSFWHAVDVAAEGAEAK